MDKDNILIGDQVDTTSPNNEQTPINHEEDTTDIDNVSNDDKGEETKEESNEPITIGDSVLEDGTEIETEDGVFTYKDGNLVDKDGKTFKTSAEIKEYLNKFNTEQETNDMNIESLKSLFDVDVTGEDGKPIEFTDDAEGRKAYVNKVIELKQKEASQIALDTFFTNNPIVKQFTDFVAAGGDVRNFGQMPDRTGIEFDPENEQQHINIIRASWKEFDKGGNIENYIKYLKDSGGLADVAKEELRALQEKDAKYKNDIAKRAEDARKQEQEELTNYWKAINNKLDSGKIANYQIPEFVTKEINGQKINLTRKDFFNYISKVDPHTHQTGYQKDLADLSDDEAMNRELLDAWMHFTGGTYKDIIDMAVKEEQVKRLKLAARTAKNPSGTVRVNKPNTSKVKSQDIIL